jgi:hypothetical protein
MTPSLTPPPVRGATAKQICELVFDFVRLVWEQPNDGLSRGFTVDGHELAHVAHVYSPTGDTGGERYSSPYYSVGG